jgi:hypothetical protein
VTIEDEGLDGLRVLVTGGSRGLGEATARRFATAGATECRNGARCHGFSFVDPFRGPCRVSITSTSRPGRGIEGRPVRGAGGAGGGRGYLAGTRPVTRGLRNIHVRSCAKGSPGGRVL